MEGTRAIQRQEDQLLFGACGVCAAVEDNALGAVGIRVEHEVQAAQTAACAGLHFHWHDLAVPDDELIHFRRAAARLA